MEKRWGHWLGLGLVFYVPFSALTLILGGRKDIRPIKNTVPLILSYFPEQLQAKYLRRKMAIKWTYTVSQKNDTGVEHYDYDIHEEIMIIFGRYVAKKISY